MLTCTSGRPKVATVLTGTHSKLSSKFERPSNLTSSLFPVKRTGDKLFTSSPYTHTFAYFELNYFTEILRNILRMREQWTPRARPVGLGHKKCHSRALYIRTYVRTLTLGVRIRGVGTATAMAVPLFQLYTRGKHCYNTA